VQTAKNDQSVLQIAVRGLQNILSYQSNCVELAKVCCLPLLKMMKDFNDVNAAAAMFNLSCVVECEGILSSEKVHLKILSYLGGADKVAKNAYLRVKLIHASTPFYIICCGCTDFSAALWFHSMYQ
jgi:hypothetical protein